MNLLSLFSFSSTNINNIDNKNSNHHHPSSLVSFNERTKHEFLHKNVLITGASSGLGRSFALLLSSQCHCNHIILSARTLSTLQTVQEECYTLIKEKKKSKDDDDDQSTTQIHIITADLGQPESVQQLAQQAIAICSSSTPSSSTAASKTIDILINNGGVSSRSSFIDTNIQIDEQIMQINFFSGALLAKAMVQHHCEVYKNLDDSNSSKTNSPRGRIIWISSVQGKLGIPNRSSYAASKFAVQGYCESIRSELYNTNQIHVHCVSPGYIRTNLSKSALTGTGSLYGQLDTTTANGVDPMIVATKICNQIAAGYMDFMVAAGITTYIAIYLKLLFPSILHKMLIKRYEKSLIVGLKDKKE
jgi:dehydrogenase/reductase SDR family member 7B